MGRDSPLAALSLDVGRHQFTTGERRACWSVCMRQEELQPKIIRFSETDTSWSHSSSDEVNIASSRWSSFQQPKGHQKYFVHLSYLKPVHREDSLLPCPPARPTGLNLRSAALTIILKVSVFGLQEATRLTLLIKLNRLQWGNTPRNINFRSPSSKGWDRK